MHSRSYQSVLSLVAPCAFNSRSTFHARYPFRSAWLALTPVCYSPRAMQSSTTTPSKLVQFRDKDYIAVREGRAHILNPPAQEAASRGNKKDLKDDDESQSVFYNPIQQFNRDLSVLAIRAYAEHLFDLKKQSQERRPKKRPANGGVKGQKRKREDEAEDQAAKRGKEGEAEDQSEVSEQPTPAADGKSEAPSEPSPATPFTILDALSATGLRALRYAAELPLVSKVVANDLSAAAIESMKTNIDYNELQGRIKPNLGDARAYMSGLSLGQKFDVIDLDPYGTAAPFIDAALNGIKDGGLLCVTCTDSGVWASTGYAEKAFALYGGIPIKGSHSHEGGLRIILHGLATSAARYGMSIEPLLSLSIDFYIRVFVRVTRSPAQVKFNAANTMISYNCDSGCGAWTTQPLGATRQKLDRKGNPMFHYALAQGPTAGPHCEHCGFKTHVAGPMWGGPLHNPHFIQKILGILPKLDGEIYHTIPRLEGMLTTALEEDLDLASSIKTDDPQHSAGDTPATTSDPDYPAIISRTDPSVREPYPFYFMLSALSRVLHCQTTPVDEFRGALYHLGYRSTRSHAKPNSIRTDAPWSVIWEIMREWTRQHSPIKEGALKPGTPGATIMGKSRDNLRKLNDQDPWLSLLKTDLLASIESGRDVSDLVTKVEACLYRSGSRQLSHVPSEAPANDAPQPPAKSDTTMPVSASETPHPSMLDINFDGSIGRTISNPHSNKRLVRYQTNPRTNWGPMNRATAASKR